jgi:hypothetical protein
LVAIGAKADIAQIRFLDVVAVAPDRDRRAEAVPSLARSKAVDLQLTSCADNRNWPLRYVCVVHALAQSS